MDPLLDVLLPLLQLLLQGAFLLLVHFVQLVQAHFSLQALPYDILNLSQNALVDALEPLAQSPLAQHLVHYRFEVGSLA